MMGCSFLLYFYSFTVILYHFASDSLIEYILSNSVKISSKAAFKEAPLSWVVAG
jgi:hypothetical protein